MLEILVVIPIVILTWGWVVLGLIGVYRVVTVSGANRQKQRIVVAIGMIAVAVCWARFVQPLTWGVDHQTIRTRNGNIEATVRYVGFRMNCLVIRQHDKAPHTVAIPLMGGRPVEIFWIQEGKTIGLSVGDGHFIADVDILFDPTINSRKLSRDEERKLNFQQRTLSPEEEKQFEAAKQATVNM